MIRCELASSCGFRGGSIIAHLHCINKVLARRRHFCLAHCCVLFHERTYSVGDRNTYTAPLQNQLIRGSVREGKDIREKCIDTIYLLQT